MQPPPHSQLPPYDSSMSKSPKKPKRLWLLVGILLFAVVVCGLCAITTNATSQTSTNVAQADPTPTATGSHMVVVMTQHSPTAIIHPTATHAPIPTPKPTQPAAHYPPANRADLHALATKGDATAIHEFHSESVGLTGVCPQPKREVTVDASITGQQLAQDLLAYFYAQHLENPCGVAVFAYHSQSETGDGYTAARILVNVKDTSGGTNIDPNATGLTYTMTLDTGGLGEGQEYVITY